MDLQPVDERTALVQRLDQYRAIAPASLADVAWAEDRWFQGRLLGVEMPEPWITLGIDDPDSAMRLGPGDSVEGIVALYASACERSRAATAECGSLDQVAAVPSFGSGPVNLRWILVHMIDETARHAGHLDLLRDALRRR